MKNDYIVTIYKGLVDGKKVREIHKTLYDMTINQKKKGLAVSQQMLKVAMNSVNQLKKKEGSQTFMSGYVKTTYGSVVEESTPLEIAAIFIFDIINKIKLEKQLSHEIVVETDKKEGEAKDKIISDNIKKNRELDYPKIFYLASKHKDSASDHAPYQGKIYVDEKWRNYVPDDEVKKEVLKYITANNVKTIQWVINKPVWFITRPNCRHYFMELGINEVLEIPKTKLLEKYKMETAIGNRQYLQTINHSTSKVWYEDIRNAELLLEKYKERLKLHRNMFVAAPSPILQNAIKKDLTLIAKWEKYILDRKRGKL